MKLKAVLAVTAALSFGGAFAQANFSDVPAGHWAKDAVEKMAAQGCIIGFPDGTFRGNEGLTRYQAALILARCLQNTTVVGGLDNETVESLKNAVQELSSELAALGVRIADVEDNAATKDDVAVLEERIAALEEAAGDKGEVVEGGDEEAGTEVLAAIDELVAADEAAAAQIEDLTGALDELVNQLEELATAQDELTSRVEALEAGAGEGNEDVTVALEDLAAGQDDLNGRVDELAATLDDVAVSIDDLNARVDELAAAGEENAAVLEEINARIEELAGAIDDVNVRVDELEGTVGDVAATVEGQTEQIESNAASIVALQDLTVLLNEDIVGLEDRISALESDKANAEDVDARFTNLNRDLTDLTNRVTVVETNLSDLQGKFNTLNGTFGFSVSGSLTSEYYVSRVTGQNFDIDRIIPGTKFSSGVDGDKDTKDSAIDWADFGDFGPGTAFAQDLLIVGDSGFGVEYDKVFFIDTDANGDVDKIVLADSYTLLPGEVLIRQQDNTGSVAGNTYTDLSLSLDFANRGLEGKSAYSGAYASDTQAFNVHKVVAEFGLSDINDGGTVGVDYSAGDPNYTYALDFYVKGVTTIFDINGAPIKFSVGENLKAKFTANVFDAESAGFGDGFVATVDGSTLPGLGAFSPKLVAVYGRSSQTASGFPVEYVRGIRGTISPMTDVTMGVHAIQRGTDALAATQGSETVYGANLEAKVSGWTISSEYAAQDDNYPGLDETDDSLFFVKVGGTAGPVTLNANYRAVSENFNGLSYDSGDNYAPTYGDNQKGFGFDASVALGVFGVKGYFDQKTDFAGNTNNNNAITKFGVSASGNVSIFTVGAYYDSKSDGAPVAANDIASAYKYGVNAGVTLAGFSVKGFFDQVFVDGVLADRDTKGTQVKYFDGSNHYNTQVGVDVKGALASVNLGAGFKLSEADYSHTTIYVDADTTFSAGVLTIKPEAHFKSAVDADTGTDDTNMFKVGVSARTTTLDAAFKPSFVAGVTYETTDHSDADVYTATTLNYTLGVKSEAFLFDKSTFALTWAGWQGKNRKYVPFSGTSSDGYFVDTNGVGDISLTGIYGEWNYYDLNFAYGDFTLNDAGAVSNGQAFKISYKVKF